MPDPRGVLEYLYENERDKILNMQPSREMDVLIAERVMDWDVHSKWIGKFDPENDYECSYIIDEPPDDCPDEWKCVTGQIISRRVPDFSTKIENAVEVLDKFDVVEIKKIKKMDGSYNWSCNLSNEWITANTLELAICRAALLKALKQRFSMEKRKNEKPLVT